MAKDVTAAIKAPRAVFVPWPMGHHFGAPFCTRVQRQVILTAFEAVQTIEQSGMIVDLPIPWAQVRRESRSLTEQGKKL
ncbi:MAG: hypothetical protein WCC99_06350 [Candidatus Sulfotelmatobacter sp.]